MLILMRDKQLPVRTESYIIGKVASLGLIQGFHDKMVDDIMYRIENTPGISWKQKQKQKKAMYGDPLVMACQNVSRVAHQLMDSVGFYVSDEDIERIWLIIDRFLTEHMGKQTFVSALGILGAVADKLPEISDAEHKLINQGLWKVVAEVSDEYYQSKLEAAHKAGHDLYDHSVYQCFEIAELRKADKLANILMKVFHSRESMDKYARNYYEHKASDFSKKTFHSLFINSLLYPSNVNLGV